MPEAAAISAFQFSEKIYSPDFSTYLYRLMRNTLGYRPLFSNLKQAELQIQREILSGELQMDGHRQDCSKYIRKLKYFAFLSDFPEEAQNQYHYKLRVWKYEKNLLKKINLEQQSKKKLLQQKKDEERKRQLEELEIFRRNERRKLAEKKLLEIQKRRKDRNEALIVHMRRANNDKSEEELVVLESQQFPVFERKEPRYVTIERQFQERELRKSLERSIFLKNRRESLQVSLRDIRLQNQIVKSIKSSLMKDSPKVLAKVEEKTLQSRLEKQESRLHAKLSLLKKLDESISNLPFTISIQKRREIQIIKDKDSNKRKYSLLHQKSLSDSKIFDKFKNFEIETNAKALGNEYLKNISKNEGNVSVDSQSPESHIPNLRIRRKTRSQQLLPTLEPPVRARFRRKYVANDPNENQYDRLAKKYKSNKQKSSSTGLLLLLEQSSQQERKAMRKISELGHIQKYEDSLSKEQEIDEHFTQALKAKIAALNCAQ